MNVATPACAAVPLWPDPRCGRCMAAEPIYKIQPAIQARLGESTLVADDRTSAGACAPQSRARGW